MKLATVGTSWITDSFINDSLSTGKWELLAVYSRDIQKAKQWGDKYSCGYYDSLEETAKAQPDAVYIASPNALHFEQVKFFLSQGIHVICEKPMFTNRTEFDQAAELAEKNGVFLLEAFRHVNSPAFEVIKNRMAEIAPIRNVIMSYNQFSSRYNAFKAGELPNIFNPAFAGGAMMDLGVYPIALAAALWGRPEEIHYTPLLLHNGIDGAGVTVLSYKGFICNITYSKIAEGWIENEILGENGAIVFDKPAELAKIRIHFGKDEGVDISAPPCPAKLFHEADRFADIIAKKDVPAYRELLEVSRVTNEIISFCREQQR